MKKLAIITACLYVGLMNALTVAQDEIALIMKSSGLVSVSYKGENKHALVSKGYLIMPEAVLQTGNNGFAVVKYIQSRSIVMRPGSVQRCCYRKNKIEQKVFASWLNMRSLFLEICLSLQ